MKIRTAIYCFATFLSLPVLLSSCREEESYAQLREQEQKLIEDFIEHGVTIGGTSSSAFTIDVKPIKVIQEKQFIEQDSTTNVEANEYVYIKKSGVYMQIVRKGSGEKLKSGGRAYLACRYVEYNLSTDSVQSSNRLPSVISIHDKMTVRNNYGTITGSFTSGIMYSRYGAAVPSGWLEPLHYINIGRQDASDEEIALVRLIVPSTEGQSDQSTYIYPCFYEISYRRDR